MLTRRKVFGRAALVGAGAFAPVATMPSFVSSAQAARDWQPKKSLPTKVQEIYCADLEGRIHVAGGFAQSGGMLGSTSEHVAYDIAADAWSVQAPLPAPRHHPQLVALDGSLYALGGYAVSDASAAWIMQDQTWRYDAATDTWSELGASQESHGETVGLGLHGRIHIIGGRRPQGSSNKTWGDHIDTDRHLVYEPASGVWSSAAPALSRRNSAAAVVIGEQFYVVGGRTVTGGNVAALEIYDQREDRWRTGAPMPQAQAGLAAATVNGKLYAFGGEYFDRDGGGVYAECWAYDPQRDQWEASINMVTPRHGLAGIGIDGWIYSIGGAVRAGGAGTSDRLERIKPPW